MSAPSTGLNSLATLSIVVLVCRACAKLVRNPEKNHRELVPERERRVTSIVGTGVLLATLSSMAVDVVPVPYNPYLYLLLGAMLACYPDFSPSGA